jgi:aminoglycoside phosphotransferase (APT) family kinase protein
VRIGTRERAYERLKRETALIQSLAHDIPVPHIHTLGQYEDYVYQIQAFIEGKTLHQAWRTLSPAYKDNIAYELASYLKVLHTISFQELGVYGTYQGYDSWLKYCEDRLCSALEEIQTLNVQIPPSTLQTIANYFERQKHVLQTANPVLVHRDLWLGNILVKDGRISAILDFEFAVQAPRDYELLLMEQFCLYPNDFAEDDDEIYTTADFADFFRLLNKHYPELFAIPDLRKRLDLYHIVYSLRAYLSWRKAQTVDIDNVLPVQPLMKVFNFLSEHGTRMIL